MKKILLMALLIFSTNLLAEDSSIFFTHNLEPEEIKPQPNQSSEEILVPETGASQKLLTINRTRSEKKLPLVIVLHGGNGAMSPVYAFNTAGKYLKVWEPYIDKVYAVATTTTWGWGYTGLAIVQNVIKWVKNNPNMNIDESKIFLWGQSMGGHGSWRIGLWLEDQIAGIIPICGGYDFADKLKSFLNLPIYHIQGDSDPLYSLKIDALKNAAWFKSENDLATQNSGFALYDYIFRYLPGGHELFQSEIPAILEWMKNKRSVKNPTVIERNWDASFVMGWRPDLFNMSPKESPERPDLQPISIAKNHWFEPLTLKVNQNTAPTSYRIEKIKNEKTLTFNISTNNIQSFRIDLNKVEQSYLDIHIIWNKIEVNYSRTMNQITVTESNEE